jgi:hypothetical protein
MEFDFIMIHNTHIESYINLLKILLNKYNFKNINDLNFYSQTIILFIKENRHYQKYSIGTSKNLIHSIQEIEKLFSGSKGYSEIIQITNLNKIKNILDFISIKNPYDMYKPKTLIYD